MDEAVISQCRNMYALCAGIHYKYYEVRREELLQYYKITAVLAAF